MDRDRDRPCGSTQHPRKYRKNLKLQNPKNGLKIFREDSKIHTKIKTRYIKWH